MEILINRHIASPMSGCILHYIYEILVMSIGGLIALVIFAIFFIAVFFNSGKAKPTPKIPKSAASIGNKYLGIPYVYGGNKPKTGLDCSGFVLLVLRELYPDKEIKDMSSWQIPEFAQNELGYTKTDTAQTDALLFWHDGTRIYHVAFAINSHDMIMAGGSGSGPKCTTIEYAKKHGAKVQISNIAHFGKPYLILRKPVYGGK